MRNPEDQLIDEEIKNDYEEVKMGDEGPYNFDEDKLTEEELKLIKLYGPKSIIVEWFFEND